MPLQNTLPTISTLLFLTNASLFQINTILPSLPPILPVAMAVDRSKFRTCHQTSFCRRHRHGKSKRLYNYNLDVATVKFFPPEVSPTATAGVTGEDSTKPMQAEDVNPPPKKNILSSISRLLPGHRNGGYTSNGGNAPPPHPLLEGDPHFRGPSPVLTAKLRNVAPFTSTMLTNKVFGNGCDGGESIVEELFLSVHLHSDGVARVRISEVLSNGSEKGSDGSGVRSTHRWTSDDLVLNEQEMISVEEVKVTSLHPQIQPLIEQLGSRDDYTVESLVKRASPSASSIENYLVLSYGSEEWKILLQFEPFALYLFRDNEGPPVIAAGTNGLTHFEVRRSKDCKQNQNSGNNGDHRDNRNNHGKRQLSEESLDENEDRHKGKEIVGYWEDGLAIYADGTREERKEVEINPDEAQEIPDGDDKGEGKEQRRLEEEGMDNMDTSGMWEEKFAEHKDSKPHGPMSVGMELTFPSSQHLFGLPEHASSTQLKTTAGKDGHHYYKEPYRLYNLDVFEYELDETMALYGHIPLVVSQSEEMGTSGAFWFNPTETFVDVEEIPSVESVGSKGESRTHFMSESGIIDLFLLPGADPARLYGQYARLTGRMPLPPMFSLGYHQCRWNYRDETDVYTVHGKFEELDYPYDVLWLDIEHTDGKRYFTWDHKLFPNPMQMQQKLGGDGRRMVTIIDPHIKRDNNYYIHKEATELGLYVKDKNGEKDYDGWCWPGSSSYLDFTDGRVRSWWADQFQYSKYKGSTPELFTWNDMNEPSVFNGPEVSMQKDLLNLNNCEHREWHNLYGMLFHRSTSEGLIKRNEGENVRPFVLSRSFFAGSQRYGAIWTGDNGAQWSHLQIATPMLLGLNVGALSFVGADVGGFFGNPDAELMTRWMQAGAYQPFFRGHAHHDSKRREPWMFGDETMIRLRRAAMARYSLLPFWYTVFWQAGATGMPVMRTLWMQYPNTPGLYSIDDQYLIGSDLLVKPVTSSGATTSNVLFPIADSWYDVDTMQRIQVHGEPNTAISKVVESNIDKIPVYQRGGSIIPRKLRLRRSSYLMVNDPYTLYVALNDDLKADGILYMDDETTFDHVRKGDYGIASFISDWGQQSIAIQNTLKTGYEEGIDANAKRARMVERIVFMGAPYEPQGIGLTLAGSAETTLMEFKFDASAKVLVVRKPGVSALDDWTMRVLK